MQSVSTQHTSMFKLRVVNQVKNNHPALLRENFMLPSWPPPPLSCSADDHFTGSMDTNVVIRHDGQIMWDSPAITKSSCKVDVSYFPFDAQQCRLTYGSWTYNGNQLDLLNAMETADLADLVNNVEWEVGQGCYRCHLWCKHSLSLNHSVNQSKYLYSTLSY